MDETTTENAAQQHDLSIPIASTIQASRV